MKSIFTIFVFAFCGFLASALHAQTGGLYGGSVVLTDSTSGNAITLLPPSSGLTSYTLALDTNKNSLDSLRWLKNDGTGNLSWDANANGLQGNGVVYTPGAPQNTATAGHYLFYIQNRSSNNNTNSPGGFVASSVVDGSNSSATGLTVNVSNTLSSATGMTLTGIQTDASSFGGGSGDQSTDNGITINVTGGTAGGGANYAALFNGGNVGFGTSTPAEQLEVSGNIRISGKNGLKVSEGSNAAMGKATLTAGSVVINTTKVTANSRIFLMDQAPNLGTPGTAYVSARTAGTSFIITSTSIVDASDVAWIIIEP